jgi:hypothetical protein
MQNIVNPSAGLNQVYNACYYGGSNIEPICFCFDPFNNDKMLLVSAKSAFYTQAKQKQGVSHRQHP